MLLSGWNGCSFQPLYSFRPVAQLAEQRSPKPQVGGSIPSWPAKAREALISADTVAGVGIG